MILTHLQQLYDEHALREAIVEPSGDGNGWMLEFADNGGERLLLTDSTGSARLCGDLDEATELAHRVGFSSVRVEERF